MNKSSEYKRKAILLRKYGFPIKYGLRGNVSAKEKTKVTKTYKSIKKYIENDKQTFVYKKANKKELKLVKDGLSGEQVTPEGYFIRKPKGAKKNPTAKVLRDNVIQFTSTGSKGGKIIETIYRIDPKLLMEDPPKAILSLGKPGDKVILTVNGFDSTQTLSYSLEALSYYLAIDLLPKFLDPNLSPAYTRAHGKRKGTKKRKIDQFVEIFHVKVIRYVRAKKKNENRNKKGKQNRKKNRRR